jgi:hypothetical protein
MRPSGRRACTWSDCLGDQAAEGGATSVARKIDCNAPQCGWALIAPPAARIVKEHDFGARGIDGWSH